MKLETYNFDGNPIRMMEAEDTSWFIAEDVANVFGYRDADAVLYNVSEDEKCCWSNLIGNRQIPMISESGLYSIVFNSRKPEARKFKKWITSTLLPTLRKTGGYISGEGVAESEDEIISLALQMVQRRVDELKPKAA